MSDTLTRRLLRAAVAFEKIAAMPDASEASRERARDHHAAAIEAAEIVQRTADDEA